MVQRGKWHFTNSITRLFHWSHSYTTYVLSFHLLGNNSAMALLLSQYIEAEGGWLNHRIDLTFEHG